MAEIIDLVSKKQEEYPVAKMFDAIMDYYTLDADFKVDVDRLSDEIISTYGCTKQSILSYLIRGFCMGVCGMAVNPVE